LWLGFFLSFAVKTPLFPFHIWLSEAHSTAPLAGSILLAAVILKLATYGYLRVLLPMFPDATNYFSPLVQTIAVITLVYASLATIRQVDTKKIVAYSSIGHQAVVVLGIFSNTIQGIEGAILLSIAHGFSSPGLFICVGGVLYNRYHTRVIAYYRGMALTMPVFTILFFIFTMSNSGVPLTLNFLGEAMSLLGMWDRNIIISVLGATGIVLSACYSFWLYGRISYGSFSPYLTVTNDVTRREFMLLISLIIPIVLFGIVPNVILDTLHVSVTSLLYNISITTPSPDLDLSFSFLLATTMGKKIQSSYSQKTCNTISSKNGNTSIEPLDSNSSRELGGLQSHSVESVKILAKSKDLENFLNWLSGFSDAESTFHIKTEPSGKTAPKISFSFKIGLHVDDIDTLKQIKSKLTELAGVEVGNISVYKLSATLAFTNLKVLKALIIPIFNAYPLISAKYLDFKDWEKAINIKSNAKVVREETLLSSPRYLLTLEEINKIIKLKEGMNSSLTGFYFLSSFGVKKIKVYFHRK
jgi:hypothetical protein